MIIIQNLKKFQARVKIYCILFLKIVNQIPIEMIKWLMEKKIINQK